MLKGGKVLQRVSECRKSLLNSAEFGKRWRSVLKGGKVLQRVSECRKSWLNSAECGKILQSARNCCKEGIEAKFSKLWQSVSKCGEVLKAKCDKVDR